MAAVDDRAALKAAAFCKCKEAMDALVRVSEAKCGVLPVPDAVARVTAGVPLQPKAAAAGSSGSSAAPSVGLYRRDEPVTAATVTSGSAIGNAGAGATAVSGMETTGAPLNGSAPALSSAVTSSLRPSKRQTEINSRPNPSQIKVQPKQETPANPIVHTPLNTVVEANSENSGNSTPKPSVLPNSLPPFYSPGNNVVEEAVEVPAGANNVGTIVTPAVPLPPNPIKSSTTLSRSSGSSGSGKKVGFAETETRSGKSRGVPSGLPNSFGSTRAARKLVQTVSRKKGGGRANRKTQRRQKAVKT